jgi:tetratricopeptide (TPR) repeat protein
MPRIPNPYITGRPVSGRDFYGREDIFRFVQNTFSSPEQNVIVLWGQRRMGKTSVLHELSSRLSPEFHPIYFDLLDKAQWKLTEVLYDLARETAGSLNLDSPPRADFLHDDDYFHERFLPRMYESLGTKRLLFMFDEFETVGMPPVEGPTRRDVTYQAFFPYLRGKLVSDSRLAFIFVTGRRLDELDELILSTFKEARTESVSFLEEAEARQLVVEPASGILEYDEEAIGQIIFVTACHPYLTQLVCFELFSYMEAAGRTQVTVGDVEAVVDRAIAAGRAGLAWLWAGLPMAERFVLSAVAHALREGRIATQYEIGRILEEYRVPFSGPELTQAPDNLTRWGLLRRTADGYEFVVELLRRWILKEYPLEQAKRELESVSPRAIVLYELARAYHEDGEYDKAIRRYHDALAVNPNHIQARLGLAQALSEQGETEEAIIEFERAYILDRVRARDGLIEARQVWAEALEKEGRVNEADQEYETILSIAPDDPRVREWVAHRWMTRGKKYLGEDRYEEAIAEYEKVNVLNVPSDWERLNAARRAWAEVLEGENRANEADRQYEAILDIAPDDEKMKEWIASCWMARGKKYLEGERYEDAVAEYDKAVVFDVPGAWEGLIAARQTWAEALEREDKADEADQQYETILSLASDDARVREWVANSLIKRGDRYLEKGRYDEASKTYDQAEDIQSEKQQTLAQRRRQLELVPDYNRAMRAHKAGDWAKAEREWAELYSKDRDYARGEGKTVAVLLAETIEKRVGISKRRQRRLILVSSGLTVILAALILWLGWGSVVTSGQIGAGPMAFVIRTPTPITPPTPVPLPTNTPHPTYTPYPTYTLHPTPVTSIEAPMPTPTPIIIVATATPGPTPTPIIIVVTATPGPTPTPITIVVTATPAPTPTPTPFPTPRFPAPRLIGPENGHTFFAGDAARIILQWEPVGTLAWNEWYQIVLMFFKPEIQYTGNRIKETEWLVPEYLHGQADQPEGAYYWNVTIVQVNQDPGGKETSIDQSLPSETWTFYWP